jgi:poly(3-hydroxybutyrate) depolymerase
MFYHLYDLNHAALQPMRAFADAMRLFYSNPVNPLSHTPFGRTLAAGAELFERTTRRYGKPAFGLDRTVVDWKEVAVAEKVVWSRPFCNLLHFVRDLPARKRRDPKLLIVAPMSGHYATLLRGTVEAMLPHADVYITDWTDARMVPVSDGRFDLDDYIDYIIAMLHHLGPDTHVMAVCQPSVPVLAAASLMAASRDRFRPSTMTLMGGPIDTRSNPTAVNAMAAGRDISWFRDNVIMQVPWPAPGFMREVYPGFLQLSGFMGMNLDRHVTAHKNFFLNLVKNDGDGAERHREFYDEYLAVMDLTAEFYLQTVDTVFIRHALPKGEMMHRATAVDPSAITDIALLTVEGENDDISGLGQTEAAHRLCANVPRDMRAHYVQPKVGHYGVFNGSRFRSEIVPRIVDFITSYGRENQKRSGPALVRTTQA